MASPRRISAARRSAPSVERNREAVLAALRRALRRRRAAPPRPGAPSERRPPPPSPADRAALLDHVPPTEPVYRLVAGIDGLFLLRRDMAGLLEAKDAARTFHGDRGPVELGGLQDLTSHAIVDRGRIGMASGGVVEDVDKGPRGRSPLGEQVLSGDVRRRHAVDTRRR